MSLTDVEGQLVYENHRRTVKFALLQAKLNDKMMEFIEQPFTEENTPVKVVEELSELVGHAYRLQGLRLIDLRKRAK